METVPVEKNVANLVAKKLSKILLLGFHCFCLLIILFVFFLAREVRVMNGFLWECHYDKSMLKYVFLCISFDIPVPFTLPAPNPGHPGCRHT